MAAPAQNALDVPGQGDALDANLGHRGRSNTAVPQTDFRQRNLVVTGGIADGRGFRGSVGYTAADDFRGAVGGDTLRGFRSYSAGSDPLLLQTLTSDSRFSSAQGLGALEFARDFGGSSHPSRLETVIRTSARDAVSTRFARDNAASILQTDGIPRILYRFPQATVTLSPVAGVVSEQSGVAEVLGLVSQYDIARMRFTREAVSNAKLVEPFETPLRRGIDANAADSKRDAAMAPESYWRAADTIVKRVTDSGSTNVDSEMDAIRKRLGEFQEWSDELLQRAEMDVLGEEAIKKKRKDEDPKKQPEKEWDPIEAAQLLRHRELLPTLVPESEGRLREIMLAAEGALQDSRYFQADKLFASAAALSLDNPLAALGRAHAQIGAGLPLSAGLHLRRLFVRHPEMIAMRMDNGKGTAPSRLAQVGEVALDFGKGSIEGERLDYGLVAAYCGYQIGNTELMEAGITMMETDPSNPDIVAITRSIWRAQ